MTDRARELVERLRGEARTIQSVSSIMVDPRATLLCKAADFIEQSLTPPEGDTVSPVVLASGIRGILHKHGGQNAVGEWLVPAANEIADYAIQSRVSPQAGMREALEIIAAPLGNPPDVQDGDTAAAEVTHWWQQLAIRYRKAARAALSTAPIPMSEAERISLENGGDPC